MRWWPQALLTLTLLSGFGAGQRVSAQANSPGGVAGIAGLPVVEIPARGASGSLMAVILSGDGGWVAVDKQMAATLTERGIPVVGFNTPSYVTTVRTPDGAAADLRRLLEHYLTAWHKDQVLLIGYSHGANLAPFMVSRLDEELRRRIVLLALLGLEDRASFEFHLADVVLPVAHPGDLPVLPEVQKLRGMPLLCVRGANEPNSLCSRLDPSLARVATHAGGHRIPGNEGREVADLILAALRESAIISSPRL